MAGTPPFLLHDFPDRAIRKLLENPRHLQELLTTILPDIAASFDFDRAVLAPPGFLLDDWRERESDLLFRVPFLAPESAPPVLVCILLEHQSAPDSRVPFRTFLYAALYWEREWREWERKHERGAPLQLSPILPIVFHTGPKPWQTHRRLADLIPTPPPLSNYSPRWEPIFWDLSSKTPAELLDTPGGWMQALAVVRAEEASAEEFQAVLGDALRRLELLADSERLRWRELLWFVLSWALQRRPKSERPLLRTIIQTSQSQAPHQREVVSMSEATEQTYEQWTRAQIRSESVRVRREDIHLLLESRFGKLPDPLVQHLDAIDDPASLDTVFRQALALKNLNDLKL